VREFRHFERSASVNLRFVRALAFKWKFMIERSAQILELGCPYRKGWQLFRDMPRFLEWQHVLIEKAGQLSGHAPAVAL